MRQRKGLVQTFISVLVLVLLLFAAAGCQPSPGARGDKADKTDKAGKAVAAGPEAGGVVTIRIALTGISEENLMVDLLIAAFQDKYSQYRVERVSLGTDGFPEKVRDEFDRGETDLLSYRWSDKQGKLMPLDPYIARSGLDLKPYGSMLDALRTDGTLSELPFGLGTSLLVYNTDMLRAAGVKEPSDGWTWDEFRQAVSTLATGTGETRVWGLETMNYEYLARAYVEEKTGGPVWEAPPEVVGEALQFFGTMVLTDGAMAKPAVQDIRRDGSWNLRWTRYRWQSLIQGRTAMTLELPQSVGSLSALPLKTIGIAPMPTHPGTMPVGVGEPVTIGIFQKAPHPDAAWEFVRFATGEEGAVVLSSAGFPAVYVSDAVREAWTKLPNSLPAGADSITRTRWIPWLPTARAERAKVGLFQRAVNQTLSGSIPWEQALAEYIQDTKAVH